jgi:hypothetical protein
MFNWQSTSTCVLKRKQKWVTFRGNLKAAEKRLRELLTAVDGGMFVEPSKVTLGEWLKEWLAASVKPRCRPSTYVRYKGIIEHDLLEAAIAKVLLQKLRPSHLEQYYAAAVSPSTLTLHHAILHRALRKAVKDRLLPMNPAVDLDGKLRRRRDRDDAREHCSTAAEARAFLVAAKAAGPQLKSPVVKPTPIRRKNRCSMWSSRTCCICPRNAPRRR